MLFPLGIGEEGTIEESEKQGLDSFSPSRNLFGCASIGGSPGHHTPMPSGEVLGAETMVLGSR
ncbi:hypothetical protein KFK09_007712 [Dendrobium nobile]|uniref:Uncharacterized protein n=1 Tax=Dendrobium nobile TaxID=94219 RepID=A0A8T3BXA2_DENNO|nr:hypothetical protein KFK09_007712 [Dendrobium nobile]